MFHSRFVNQYYLLLFFISLSPRVMSSEFKSQTPSSAIIPPQPGECENSSKAMRKKADQKEASPAHKAKQQKVIIPNKDGENLVGLLHETGSKEIVILCHGFLCTKENNTIKKLALALENDGISAFRFDFAGNGKSQGSLRYGRYWGEVEDLRAVIEYIGGVANRAVNAIIGHSKGGDVVLLYASKYHDVHTVVNISGRFELMRGVEFHLGKDYMEMIKKEGFVDVKNNKTGSVVYRVTRESLVECQGTNMGEVGSGIEKECKVLTVHGSADKIVPVEDALEFAKVIANHKLHIIEGAEHGYTAQQTELATVVLDFVRRATQQDCDTNS